MPDAAFRWYEVTIDCRSPETLVRFWSELLGGEVGEPLPGWRRLHVAGAPLLNFQPVPEPKQGKARVHLDLAVPDVDAAIERVTELGGRFTGERHDYPEGVVVVLADPEGTEFCLAQLY